MFILPAEVNATERGREHTLMCSSQGGPGNRVRWIKQGYENEILSEMPELVVNITSATVGGMYLCIVTNFAGSDSSTAVVNGEFNLSLCPSYLDWSVPPVIPVLTEEPHDTNVTRTETLMLFCSADGFPTPMIVWFHNGSAVGNSSRITIIDSLTGVTVTSMLMVMTTTFSDSGNYSCEATSPVFDDIMSRETLVFVQGKPRQYFGVVGFILMFSQTLQSSLKT